MYWGINNCYDGIVCGVVIFFGCRGWISVKYVVQSTEFKKKKEIFCIKTFTEGGGGLKI